jgi:twitching motility two-component system response regulator PilH
LARKILLADDSVTAQNMGRRILTDAGYEVTTVNNGSAALKRIAESKPDLIVLDVYMPGYGGLEVCQRIRESEETARIPVLLTVGKLEPFKPEEARRVRADAYVVKPFEASELLTALTKLEDKIVPTPQPGRASRSPVPTIAIERMSAGKSFGDAETGWKNRLTIPAPHQKAGQDRPEEPEANVEPARPASIEAISQRLPEKPPERTSGGMGDITPDEIAAITAAAAAFSAQGEDPFAKLIQAAEAKTAAPETKPETAGDGSGVEIGATFAAVTEVENEAEKESPTVESVPAVEPAPVAAAETAVASEAPVEVPSSAAPLVEETASSPACVEPSNGKLAQEEVVAALASLAPVGGVDESQSSHSTMTGAQQITGPRWVAETVALADDEAALILEQEMRKAQAAMAAAAQTESASEPTAQFAVTPPEIAGEPEPESAYSAPAAPVEVSVPQQEAQEIAMSAIESQSRVEAVAEQVEPVPSEAREVREEALAASASAGTSGDAISTVDARAVAPAETQDAPPLASADQRESELAAAWASWKQVRDSVANPQLTSQIADAAAAGLAQPAPPEPAPAREAATADAPEETGAIASIVDSVLAELKPKLMEEIAKKIKK